MFFPMKYEPISFDIPELDGISKETIDGHLGLYQGYVKHVNLIREKIKLLQTQADLNDKILEEWKAKETASIKKDPSKYIDS